MVIDVIVLILNLPMKITTDHLVGICLVHFLEPSTHKKSQIGIAQPSRLTSLKFWGLHIFIIGKIKIIFLFQDPLFDDYHLDIYLKYAEKTTPPAVSKPKTSRRPQPNVVFTGEVFTKQNWDIKVSSDQKTVVICCISGIIEIMVNHYKDPYQQISILSSV